MGLAKLRAAAEELNASERDSTRRAWRVTAMTNLRPAAKRIGSLASRKRGSRYIVVVNEPLTGPFSGVLGVGWWRRRESSLAWADGQ